MLSEKGDPYLDGHTFMYTIFSHDNTSPIYIIRTYMLLDYLPSEKYETPTMYPKTPQSTLYPHK